VVEPRQSQAAPTPDYGSGRGTEPGILDDPERCSCDEALALRAELVGLRAALLEAEARAQQAEELQGGLLHRAWTLEARVIALRNAQLTPPASVTETISATPSSRVRSGSSRFKGVSWHAKSGKWRARVRAGDKRLSLGAFASEDEAAGAIDRALHVMGAIRG
jgi:hypothetical protein